MKLIRLGGGVYRILRKRTAESFLASVRHLSKKYSYEQIATYFGINKWHVWQIVNNKTYHPSYALCRKLNITKKKRTHRFAIYPDIEHLDNTIALIEKQMDTEARKALKERL